MEEAREGGRKGESRTGRVVVGARESEGEGGVVGDGAHGDVHIEVRVGLAHSEHLLIDDEVGVAGVVVAANGKLEEVAAKNEIARW